MPIITSKSCYIFIYILPPEKFSHVTPSVFFYQVVLVCRLENLSVEVLVFHPAGPDIEPSQCTFHSTIKVHCISRIFSLKIQVKKSWVWPPRLDFFICDAQTPTFQSLASKHSSVSFQLPSNFNFTRGFAAVILETQSCQEIIQFFRFVVNSKERDFRLN